MLSKHIPVMVKEVLHFLNLTEITAHRPLILDATFGQGGHAKNILNERPDCHLLCLDRDPESFEIAQQLSSKNSNVTVMCGLFSDLPDLLKDKVSGLDGILFDVGASSTHFDTAARGFAIHQDGPLDMRMDKRRISNQLTGADVVNTADEKSLCQILRKYGEEPRARSIARGIIDHRHAIGRITTTGQLANLVANLFNREYKHDVKHRPAHVATKTFQALRIFVNNELNELYNGLSAAERLLKPGGRCVCISFHSLEDRLVKQRFANIHLLMEDQNRLNSGTLDEGMPQRWLTLTKTPVTPSDEEIKSNPRSRSAKLRAATRLAN